MIQHITNANDFVEIVSSRPMVLLDIHEHWCNPCKRMKPVLAALSEQMTHISFAAVTVKELEMYGMDALRNEVNAVPTLMFFKHGKRVDTNYGYMDPAALEQWLVECSQ